MALKTKVTAPLKTLDGSQPHPDWRGWKRFLASCDVRDRVESPTGNVVFYGVTNCNYILFPNGYIVRNYAFHGANLMREIREKGWQAVWDEIERHYHEMKAAAADFGAAVDRLCDSLERARRNRPQS